MLSHIPQMLFGGIGLASLFWAFLGSIGGQINSNLVAPATEECTGCHKSIGDHWTNSAHGQAATNEAFNKAWDEQGNLPVCMTCHATGYNASSLTWESPGVGCLTCHTPYNENHPAEIMPTDVSSRLCGNCHLETFGQFQDSAHSNANLTCNGCHNAHTTSLKTANSQDLCQACHNEKVHSFELTVHSANGLLCTDCHLRVLDTVLGEGHGKREHTFEVSLETCTECHSAGLHAPTQISTTDAQNTEEALVSPFPAQPGLQTEPEEVSPVGFVVLATLFGVGFGMVMAPWLEKWYRQFRNKE
ncbi:MAG TPA: multiheme c-type cytochrome [Thermoguttaceae bacterium]